MKTLIVSNSSKKDIIDYKISEAKIDPETQDAIINTGTGLPEETGRTLEWTVMAGEELEFPAYVARYLKGTFDFLNIREKTEVEPDVDPEETEEPIEADEPEEPEIIEVKPVDNTGIMCKFCGKSFDTTRKLGMHMGAAHAEELAKS